MQDQSSGVPSLNRERIRSPRLLREIAAGFIQKYPDEALDEAIKGLVDAPVGYRLDPSKQLHILVKKDLDKNDEGYDSQQRIKRLNALECHPDYLVSTLRDLILTHCREESKSPMIDALMFMLRLHIDDKNRKDNDMPGVSHQLEVATAVFREILSQKQPGELLSVRDAEIVVAAMWHDAVEDHQRLIMLETDKIIALMDKKVDGKFVVRDDPSVVELSLKLLGEHSSPFIEQLLTGLTLNRAKLLKDWKGMQEDEARALVREDDEKGGVLSDPLKRELYGWYVLDTFTDPSEAGEAKSLIKMKDLVHNALTIGKLLQRADLIDRGLIGDYQDDEERKVIARRLTQAFYKLREKYLPVLRYLHDELLPKWNEQTYVGRMKGKLIRDIGGALDKGVYSPNYSGLANQR